MIDLHNALAGESSPYLRQHAHQPVAWQTWNPETLALARRLDRPILLSVGYAACHWCHVMAHECFDDPAVAQVMNRHFVNVKVDREERPDLDQIYQTAHQLLTGRAGGWPLTMFLTPEGEPFYGGTYFPKSARFGLPGFPDLCMRIAEVWQKRRQEIEAQNREVVAALARFTTLPSGPVSALDATPLALLTAGLLANFDSVHGGFGDAPKFPQPTDLAFLLTRENPQARQAALLTLKAMAAGGLYDHLGGGFFRYSVDARWEIPHFEKMLYDNAQLIDLYSWAAAITGEASFRNAASETVAWLFREMSAAEGGFFSALDADSEGEEGRFYLWRREEVAEVLEPHEYVLAAEVWGLDQAPNFEHALHHLRQTRSLSAEEEVALASARRTLWSAREKRVRPGLDDKVLTSWNALTIAALLRAARRLDEPVWAEQAERALANIASRRWRDGVLYATDRLPGYLDDYAFLLDALLERLAWCFRRADYDLALALAEALLTRFEDSQQGGFFFTGHDHERLIVRSKNVQDQALPSGYGMAVRGLLRLSHLNGESRYRTAAERALRLVQPRLAQAPLGMATLALALEDALTPLPLVILRGPREGFPPWQAFLGQTRAIVVALPNGAEAVPEILARPESMAVNAWVCRGVSCLAPTGNLDELARILQRDLPAEMAADT